MNRIIGGFVKTAEVFGWLLCGYSVALYDYVGATVFGIVAILAVIILIVID